MAKASLELKMYRHVLNCSFCLQNIPNFYGRDLQDLILDSHGMA